MKKILAIFLAILFSANFVSFRAQEIAMEGVGVKEIIVGNNTRDDVIRKFGNNYKVITHESYSKQLQYKEIGLSFFYCQSDKNEKIFSIEM